IPTVSAPERFGQDLALATHGAMATASSAAPHNPATEAINGLSDAADGGDFTAIPAWVSAVGDITPTLTITFPHTEQVDRVLVSSHSIGSVVPGLRDYDVQVAAPHGTWTTVARARNDFYQRRHLFRFPTKAT